MKIVSPKTQKPLLLLTLTLALWSCTRDVVIDFPEHKSRLVVNGVITPDSIVSVRISRSVSILDTNNNLVISNATVTLQDEGITSIPLVYNPSTKKYEASGYQPLVGHTYHLLVSAPGFDEARASCTVPPPLALTNVSVRDSARRTEDGVVVNQIRYTLPDPSGKNYYFLDAQKKHKQVIFKQIDNNLFKYDTVEVFSSLYLFTEYTSYQNTWSTGAVIFNDALFDGKRYDGTVEYSDYSYNSLPDTSQKELRLYLRNTDAFYHEYQRKLYWHMNNKQGGLFTGEPVNMPTNVTNGYGLFAAYTQSVTEITY
jgi:hypothetical protein